jgi:dihydrofolate reductase
MKITLVAAMSRKNRVIGINGTLPWNMPNDMLHFRQLTLGKLVLMGRKTFISIGRALPGRENIILSRDSSFIADGCRVFSNIESALGSVIADELMVIGGADIYMQLLSRADVMQLTLVDSDVGGDAIFPDWNQQDWDIVAEEFCEADSRHKYAYSFVTLRRNNN